FFATWRPQPAAAQGGDAPAAPGDAGGAPEAGAPKSQSEFMWVIRSSGWIGLLILGLSMYFIATIIRLFMEMRMDVAAPPADVARCEDLIREKDFKTAYDFMRENDTMIGRVLTAGISELSNGLPDAREALERAGE